MKKYWWLKSSLLYLLFFACGKPLPTLEGLDLKAWEQDKNACLGTRTSSLPVLEEQKNKLLGLDELDVTTLLGNPDEHELYKRNEKFFYYYLEPSEACDSTKKISRRLSIRFNAMGLAKEVMVE